MVFLILPEGATGIGGGATGAGPPTGGVVLPVGLRVELPVQPVVLCLPFLIYLNRLYILQSAWRGFPPALVLPWGLIFPLCLLLQLQFGLPAQ